jgi:hypothetical protein
MWPAVSAAMATVAGRTGGHCPGPGRAGGSRPTRRRHPPPGRRANQSHAGAAWFGERSAEGGRVRAFPQTVSVRVPLTIRCRGGRKLVVTPEGDSTCPSTPPRRRVDSTLVKALGRAHRWKRLLENGTYASISELANAEKIDRGYLGRILQLALLAPEIVEAILDGRQPPELGLPRLMKPFPVTWSEQRDALMPLQCVPRATRNHTPAPATSHGISRATDLVPAGDQ